MKKIFCLCLIMLLSLTACSNEPLRLHVIANSDNDADQGVKLEVRDAVLEYTSEQMLKCQTLKEAQAQMSAMLPGLEAQANKLLKDEGFSYSAYAVMGRFMFPEKTYGDVTYPAGEYEAVRIILGQGQGQNWWCVMFPPLCVTTIAAEQQEEEKVEYKSAIGEFFSSVF